MFGLRSLFAALARLTASVNRSADLFDAANQALERQLAVGAPDSPPALEHQGGNGAPAARKPARK